MNTSQPVSSYIGSVSFSHLSDEEIRALSAKRITTTTTFDTLLNPIPGGLYSPELGSYLDNACATCGYHTPQCPGHPGHIELPVPCYHPTYMDQTLKLMKASCLYCGRLRLGKSQVFRLSCRLRLINHGLLKEAEELDQQLIAEKAEEDEDSDSEDEESAKVLKSNKAISVDKIIAKAKSEGRVSTQRTEVISNARIAAVREIMRLITYFKKCQNCDGANHAYRKDRFVKIFRKPLTEKERLGNIQRGLKAQDPLILMKREKARAEKSRKRKRDVDEGIADMDGSSDEESQEAASEEEEEEESEDEPEIAGANPVNDAAGEGAKKKPKEAKNDEEYLNPSRVHAQLTQLFAREQEFFDLLYGQTNDGTDSKTNHKGVTPDMFFIKSLLVPPNRFRPESKTDGGIAEADSNQQYKDILSRCDMMAQIEQELSGKSKLERLYRRRTYEDFENTWVQLQDAVNSMIDKDRSPVQGSAARRVVEGVKQKLEKKEGVFRTYMMGKRVNFAARTVLSPDPSIETNEIGVPPVFAIKLTYPEPVTDWNVEELQQAVKNGPLLWPGAVAIESENGQVINLAMKNGEERTALANQLLAPSTAATGLGSRGTRPKKVHRHLSNGDIVIMNRQPTLHKPSMMCHRARILPGEKTLRMHYANCNTYNADFDGDEMNLHFPQNELARAEALSIADTDHQYLSATAGNPLRGLIQDHISMALWLTNRDTFFERDEYMQLLYAALRPESGHCASGRIETVPPTIFKPKALWSGKQVITTVLKNVTPFTHQGLTMSGSSTTDKKLWGKEGAQEQDVIVKDGYLCTGVMDKKQIGPSSGGVVNALYEAYGHTIAGRVLSVLGRLLTRMLQTRAFSCGVEDLVFTKDGEKDRLKALAGASGIGLQVAAKYVTLDKEKPDASNHELVRRLEEVLRDESKQTGLDQLTNAATKDLSSAVTNACLPYALVKPFPKNQMQSMTSSGAKGSKVNANQISCNLGQQVLEGRRVPVMVSGKTLPCFKPFETSVRAGGYIVDRFLTGVRPQEYYFHAMAGREGLIDTAVKTSRSGYLQRCLVKGMEGLKVEYDTSVRDTTDGSLIQWLYGEDGLDVAKAKYLSDMKFTVENHLSLFETFGMRNDFDKVMSEEAAEYNKKAEKKYRRTGDLGVMDPALAKYSPSRNAGSTSEKMLHLTREYIDENPDKLLKDKKKGIEGVGLIKRNFQAINDVRYLKSIVEAGEAVGVVAAQSVGEPSTQMTLNTFHLAGHSAKNVTLGIPRLREIVMTAAKDIKTPTMMLRCRPGVTHDQARTFAKSISRLSLAEILDQVTVTESIGKGTTLQRARKYKIQLDLFPRDEYQKEYAVTIAQITEALERAFLPRLQLLVRKEIKRRTEESSWKVVKASMAAINQSVGTVEQETARPQADAEGGDDDSDAEGDDDATRDKQKRNQMQAGYEGQEDDEEVEMRERARREASVESMEDEGYGGTPPPAATTDDDTEAEGNMSFEERVAKARQKRIREDAKTHDVTSFSFDEEKADQCTFTMEYDISATKISMLSVVEKAARTSLIQSVPGIGTCIFDEFTTNEANKADNKGLAYILTQGVNIPDMWHYWEIIDSELISTNSVYDVLKFYGVEAARNCIVAEIQSVFNGHGISVDPRHLTLIADYMTRDGVYQAFSRIGYKGNVSPFMKMSFETTIGFLKDAVLAGEVEELKGPSSRIVVGGLSQMGTGGFGVFMPVKEEDEKVEGAMALDGITDVAMKDEDDENSS